MTENKDNKDVVVSVSGNKVSLAPDAEMLKQLSANLPPDAAELLAKMQSAASNMDMRNISNTSPGLNREIQKEINDAVKSHELVRAIPQEIKQVLDQQKILEEFKTTNDSKIKMTIHESGIALGIMIGKSDKKEVDEIIKGFSSVSSESENDLMFFYSDIGITVFYNDEMIVRELQFGTKFKGATSKGLQPGDTIDTAIEIYGQPRMKTPKGAIWNKFGVFCQNNIISSIRLMS